MPYVYSTCTASCDYVEYKPLPPGAKDMPHNEVVRRVHIKGGHGVPNKHLHTPRGVVTEVSDKDLEFLLNDPNFQRHMAAGHISYEKTKKVDPEKKVETMTQKDGSALLTPEDLQKEVEKDAEVKTFKSKARK